MGFKKQPGEQAGVRRGSLAMGCKWNQLVTGPSAIILAGRTSGRVQLHLGNTCLPRSTERCQAGWLQEKAPRVHPQEQNCPLAASWVQTALAGDDRNWSPSLFGRLLAPTASSEPAPDSKSLALLQEPGCWG